MKETKVHLSKMFGYLAIRRIRSVNHECFKLTDHIEAGGNQMANIGDAQKFYFTNFLNIEEQIVFI